MLHFKVLSTLSVYCSLISWCWKQQQWYKLRLLTLSMLYTIWKDTQQNFKASSSDLSRKCFFGATSIVLSFSRFEYFYYTQYLFLVLSGVITLHVWYYNLNNIRLFFEISILKVIKLFSTDNILWCTKIVNTVLPVLAF